jgi:hypothetical protein
VQPPKRLAPPRWGIFCALNSASGHIGATTLWAFDLAITLWALRNLNF